MTNYKRFEKAGIKIVSEWILVRNIAELLSNYGIKQYSIIEGRYFYNDVFLPLIQIELYYNVNNKPDFESIVSEIDAYLSQIASRGDQTHFVMLEICETTSFVFGRQVINDLENN